MTPAGVASAATKDDARLTIRGAGFGHGVGMSQYGALGYAQHGASYREILSHYYTGTSLGSAESRTVRVLIGSPSGTVRFSAATRAGDRKLDSRKSYGARANGGAVDLLSSTGRRLKTLPAPLRLTSSAPIALAGKGAYRGAVELRPAGRGLNVINAVSLDDYVQGVVPLESPSSWPLEALKAQAVAARTYALTTSKGGDGFEQYADTRSQVYGGVGAEAASGNQAVQETAGEVVTYKGSPVVTYFFSTSGGRTEDVEKTSLGSRPLPWLKSVRDPYDDVSPKHRWGPLRLTLKQAGAKLNGLVKGSFRGVEVISRGRSPRIVAADVVGTGGRVRVTGAQLRARFGLFDSWAYFTTVSTRAESSATTKARASAAGSSRPARRSLVGSVIGARRGAKAVVEIETLVGWRRAGTVVVRGDGAYRFGLCTRGSYRVRAGSAAGPVVTIR